MIPGRQHKPSPRAMASGSNGFLDPILERWRMSPDLPFGYIRSNEGFTTISLARLMESALRYAELFRSRNIVAGSVIPIILRHDLDAHAAFLGAMLMGAVPSYLPYPNQKHGHALYWKQHRTLFEHVRPPAILVYDDLCAAMRDCTEGLAIDVIPQSAARFVAPSSTLELPENAATALLQHSSGTTGLKKGVELSFAAIARQLQSYRDALRLDAVPTPVVASWLPLYHDMGLMTGFLLPLWLGAPVVMIDPFEWVARPAVLLEAVATFRATHVWLPNFAYLHLARMVPKSFAGDLGSLAAIVNCSEPCKPAAFDTFLARFSALGVRPEALQTCYAMAETVFAVTQSKAKEPPRRVTIDRSCIHALGEVREPSAPADAVSLLSNGPPVEGCRVRIGAPHATRAERWIGEVAVNASFMFSGYYRNPEATAAAFDGEWFRTGDIGFIDQGELFLIGRLKEVIIVNGKNIFANDVEEALIGTAGLKPGRAVAFGRYSEQLGSEQLIVVAETDPATPSPRPRCRSR